MTATFSGSPEFCVQFTRPTKKSAIASTVITSNTSSDFIAVLEIISDTVNAEVSATIKLIPCTPAIGAIDLSDVSIYALPSSNHGKPVNNHPRNHSSNTHRAGKIKIMAISLHLLSFNLSASNLETVKEKIAGYRAKNITNIIVTNTPAIGPPFPNSAILIYTQ